MNAREVILARLRTALADDPAPQPVPRGYGRSLEGDDDATIEPAQDWASGGHDRIDAGGARLDCVGRWVGNRLLPLPAPIGGAA